MRFLGSRFFQRLRKKVLFLFLTFRYTIKPEASPAPARGRQSSPAGLSECSSETSSTSAPQQRPQPQKTSSAQNAQPQPPSAEDNKCKVRTKPWNLNTKNLKDLLVRTYPSFAQIIISPVSTGLRHTINTNVVSDTQQKRCDLNSGQFSLQKNFLRGSRNEHPHGLPNKT